MEVRRWPRQVGNWPRCPVAVAAVDRIGCCCCIGERVAVAVVGTAAVVAVAAVVMAVGIVLPVTWVPPLNSLLASVVPFQLGLGCREF